MVMLILMFHFVFKEVHTKARLSIPMKLVPPAETVRSIPSSFYSRYSVMVLALHSPH